MQFVTRLAVILALLASPAFADARNSAKFVQITKAPASVIYPKGCGSRDSVAEALTGKWAEKRTGAGVSSIGPVEIYVSPKGTFTVVLTKPDGSVSCVLSSGDRWRAIGQPGV